MTHIEFIIYHKCKQVDLTLENGTPIAQRWDNGDYMRLFHMGSFYVELRYLDDQSEVVAIYSSDTDSLLEPYLDSIDISDVI